MTTKPAGNDGSTPPQRTPAQVDDTRRLLRRILSRRDFVEAAGALTLAFAALDLSGCSSGDGGKTTGPPTTGGPVTQPGTIPDGLQSVSGAYAGDARHVRAVALERPG